ncbi:MAG: Tad domain-containing protein [Candidatus Nealsonbacteria bacterium]|nr:Tad domain-containing protein [Candidatus Nealsonbacteria bacterium]
MSVFALMVLTMLLGMVMNVGRQVDGKIRMQNSADAAAYSGGVVLARGMNTLAFTNHLLCDVFSMTAFMREARDRNAQSFTPDILAAWSNVGSVFSSSGFPKFSALGPAIQQKVPMEQQLVDTYSDWAAASSERILPVMEAILAEEMIPQYQQAVVLAFPDVAQAAVREVSRRNGQPDRGREQMTAALWRSSGQPVGGDYEMFDPSLPVVDPVYGMMPNQEEYLSKSRKQRRDYSYRYLRAWNRQAMYIFDREAKMSQFGTLWRSFTSGQLKKLLDEYPYTNLPFMIRTERADMADPNWHLDRFFTFVAVTYWKNVPERMPGVFENPTQSDSQAYAAVRLFIPRSRLIWIWHRPGGSSSPPIGGVPGDFPPLPGMDTTGSSAPRGPGAWLVGRQGVPTQWDLLNQHWTCQLVPATQSSLCDILQTQPPPGDGNEDFVLPNLGGIDSEDIGRISPH